MIIQTFFQFIRESNDFKRVLKQGDYGDDVKALQKGLGMKDPDGDFGENTKKITTIFPAKLFFPLEIT